MRLPETPRACVCLYAMCSSWFPPNRHQWKSPRRCSAAFRRPQSSSIIFLFVVIDFHMWQTQQFYFSKKMLLVLLTILICLFIHRQTYKRPSSQWWTGLIGGLGLHPRVHVIRATCVSFYSRGKFTALCCTL